MQRKIAWTCRGVTLFHYEHMHDAQGVCPPLLIIFSTVNKPSILDLTEKQSFIKQLMMLHVDIFLLDWGDNVNHQPNVTIANYVDDYLFNAIQHIKEMTTLEKINVLGICQGGIWSLCYASLYQDINKLILISVPVDFKTDDHIIANITRHINQKMINTINTPIPGALLTQFFMSLHPFSMIKRRETSKKRGRLTQWLFDSPDQPHDIFKNVLIDFYQKNKLIKNKIKINKKKVNLKNITIPILNIMADKDNIVPKSASLLLEKWVGSKVVTNTIIEGGHISIYLKNEQEATLPTHIATFIHSNTQ